MIKAQQFSNLTGMNMDISPSKRNSTLAYQIKNMRFNSDDTTSTLSIINEKGPKEIKVYDEKGNIFHIKGTLLGTCVLNQYLVLFCKGEQDFIYRLTKNKDSFTGVLLYKGNLGFKLDSKFETLGIYENDSILKIYWIDGINQPRVINIVKDVYTLLLGPSTQFDFLPTDLMETLVQITKIPSVGLFKAGTIQYAFSYFNKNEAQTNIFYISPIQYISSEIGAETDSTVNCAFKISIDNLNPLFDKIRIYSIFRASPDTLPQASIVKDIDIQGNNLTFIDNGDTLTSIDYNELLFLNNTSIIPSTMTAKDNTLFLGNFKYNKVFDQEIKTLFKNIDIDNIVEFKLTLLLLDFSKSPYMYTNQLKYSLNKIAGFKGGEFYTFGFILLDINNRWTSVIPLGNKYNKVYPKCITNSLNNSLDIYIVKAFINKTWFDTTWKVINTKYPLMFKAIKFVIVSKTEAQRNILCQGIVNPTVYCFEDRINNQAPFAQSSWFFRPVMEKEPEFYNNRTSSIDGAVTEYRHLMPVAFDLLKYLGTEIQSMLDSVLGQYLISDVKTKGDRSEERLKERHNFGVDSSIITLHSPDVEFNGGLLHILDRRKDLQLEIVGYSKLKNINSNTKTTLLNSHFTLKSSGKYVDVLENFNKLPITITSEIPKGLVDNWGAKSFIYNLSTDGDELITNQTPESETLHKVYPWQRSTSIINQATPKFEEEQWVAGIDTKILSNIRFCGETVYSDKWSPKNGISEIAFVDDTTTMVKLPEIFNSDCTYYGKIDTLLTNTNYRPYSKTDNKISPVAMNIKIEPVDRYPVKAAYRINDPIRMRYKSTAHLVTSFNPYNNKYVILPSIHNVLTLNFYPDWISLELKEEIFQSKEQKRDIVKVDFDITDLNKVKELIQFLCSVKGSANAYGIYVVGKLSYTVILTQERDSDIVASSFTYTLNKNLLQNKLDFNIVYTNGTDKIVCIKAYEEYLYQIEYSANILNSQTLEFNIINQDIYAAPSNSFFVAELKTNYGELSLNERDLLNYIWLAASDTIYPKKESIELFGDTYFQRYDCLKTYPYTDRDPNLIVDIASFMIETYINIDGRWDRNRGLLDNTYITNTNFNHINKAYTLYDKSIPQYVAKEVSTAFPTSVLWTLPKISGNEIDAWTHLTGTSILDLNGNKGKLEKLLTFQNTILFFQDKSLGTIQYNDNVALATNTGLPIELANSGKVQGSLYYNELIGCQNKDTIITSKQAVYFIDGNTKTIYQIKQPLEMATPAAISDAAFQTYLKQKDINKAYSRYNPIVQDVYFIFNEDTELPCLTYNELLLNFTSFYDYTSKFINTLDNDCYHLTLNNISIFKLHAGEYNYFYNKDFDKLYYSPFYITLLANGELNDSIKDKIWNNIEFRADSWKDGTLTNNTFDILNSWNEYQHGTVSLTCYGFNDSAGSVHIPSSLKKKFRIWRANFPRALYDEDNLIYIKGYEKLIEDIPDIEGTLSLPDRSIHVSRDRIRNPWTYVQLCKEFDNTEKTILHNILIYYYD